MRKRITLFATLAGLAMTCIAGAADKPNIIFIMADDLGYGDLGCYGQELIKTPRLDRMAEEGMKFTQFYSGSTVCAPARCVLMTGRHTGRCSVRGNGAGARQALLPGETTVAEALKEGGYSTALIGKWGLGDFLPEAEHALPNREGFDYFFGYANQVHAHNYYPEFLYRNEEKFPLRNKVQRVDRSYGGFTGGAATFRVDYSHDILAEDALEWVKEKHHEPFFLYLALTIPHANNEGSRLFDDGAEVPDYGYYRNLDWPDPDKGQAAMITRMDKDIGRLLDLLEGLGIADNTLVMFTSDNGPHDESNHNPERFDPSGPLTGMKRDLTEGGIRVPMIAWWPGTVPAGTETDHISYFGDFFATACDVAGLPVPEGLDSVSFLPMLKGDRMSQKEHRYLYWQFYEQGSKEAVRFGDWKAIRKPMFTGNIELYDLTLDLAEQNNLAEAHPEKVELAKRYMKEAHVPDERWTTR